jgi:CBS domain containing-hemolysin-like protein
MSGALYGLAAILLLAGATLLEEAVVWFSRHALDRRESDDDASDILEMAGAARRSRLIARFLTAVVFAGLAAVYARRGSAVPMIPVVGAALVWSMGASALAAVHWQSPLGLAGRLLFRPLRGLGVVLRAVLTALRWIPGLGRMLSPEESLDHMDYELRWLLGGQGEDEEGKMLATLQEFGEALVEDVLVPREEVAGIPAGATLPEILTVVREEGYTRYPVYRDTLDGVTGVLHVFDLLQADPGAVAADLVREPLFANATKPVGALLRELQVTYNQMAVVVDEYGGTAGIVTVEDLLEELVGEIHDELDVEEETSLRRLEPGVFWVDGAMRIEDLNETLGLDLDEGEYDTVAGLVLERLERIPRPGERVREDGVWIEVASAEPNRIIAVRLILIEGDRETGAGSREAR